MTFFIIAHKVGKFLGYFCKKNVANIYQKQPNLVTLTSQVKDNFIIKNGRIIIFEECLIIWFCRAQRASTFRYSIRGSATAYGRWRLISAQVVSCYCVYEMPKQQIQFIKGFNKIWFTIGQIDLGLHLLLQKSIMYSNKLCSKDGWLRNWDV